jgi:hypothetical protein
MPGTVACCAKPATTSVLINWVGAFDQVPASAAVATVSVAIASAATRPVNNIARILPSIGVLQLVSFSVFAWSNSAPAESNTQADLACLRPRGQDVEIISSP